MRPLAQTLVALVLPVVQLHLAPCLAEAHGGAARSSIGVTSGPHLALPFSHDDYAAARMRAQRESKLLIVEAWATWCHTCQSMRNFVFTDPLLRPMADRFVFVALDTDRPINAAFVERFPIASWPTMLVLDPGQSGTALKDERIISRWIGAMTAPELLGRLGHVTARPAGVDKLLEDADTAASEQRWDAAAPLYADVVQQSVMERPRALLGQIQALREKSDYPACVELVATSLQATGNNANATDFAAYAAACLDHDNDADQRQKLRQRLRGYLTALVDDSSAPLSVDDRSDAYGTLIELSDGLGDGVTADRFAESRLRLLESAAAAARTPADASTYDLHRLDSYRRLKRYDEAERMLTTSIRALPNDFNAPARLAKLYQHMGRLDDALQKIDDALSKSYGPRMANLLEIQANIRQGLGKTQEAVQSLLAAIVVIESQPIRNERKLALLRKQIASLQSTLSSPSLRPGSKTSPSSLPVQGPGRQSPTGQRPMAVTPAAATVRLTQGRNGHLGASTTHPAG